MAFFHYDQHEKLIDDKLSKLGLKITDFIGSGSYGETFVLNNGNVLKITTDKKEARAMSLLKNKETRNIVKIFNVWLYNSLPEVFFIEQERLTDVPDKIENFVIALYQIKIKTFKVPSSVMDFLEYMFCSEADWEDAVEYYQNKFHLDLNYYLLYLVKKNNNGKLTKFFKDMLNAKKELEKFNIKYNDFKEEHILQADNKDYKIIDLSNAKSPGVVDTIYEQKSKGAT